MEVGMRVVIRLINLMDRVSIFGAKKNFTGENGEWESLMVLV